MYEIKSIKQTNSDLFFFYKFETPSLNIMNIQQKKSEKMIKLLKLDTINFYGQNYAQVLKKKTYLKS